MASYVGLIRKEKKSDYGVEFPDFPGCITAGKTLDDARKMASEALEFHVESMIKDGEAIPEPSSLDKIMQIRANQDAVAILVDARTSQTSRRINITIKEDLLRVIDQYARKHQTTRSTFLSEAAIKAIKSSKKVA